jgi:DNA-binding CsgD family transcriptional regulator
MDLGEFAAARNLIEQSLTLQRELGDDYGIAWSLAYRGQLAFFLGDLAAAATNIGESLQRFRDLRDAWGIGASLFFLGRIAVVNRDYDLARSQLVESLNAIAVQLPWAVSFVLDEFALLAVGQGRHRRALRLAGAAAALRDAIGSPLAPAWAADVERRLAPARLALPVEETEAALAEGRVLTQEAAIAEAMASPEPVGDPADPQVDRYLDGLTPREREVASLVAQGLTNRQIGAALYISEGTAALHVKHVLGKLGMTSRTQVAAWILGRAHTDDEQMPKRRA